VTAAEDFDPYLLPLPAPASPVVAAHLASPLHAHLNGRYADQVWPLAPLTGNPSTRKPSIYWEHWPAAFRDEMRLAAWNLINGQLRPTFLRGHSRRMRSRPSMTEVNGTLTQWRQLARWLEERGIRSLAGCDASVLDDYSQHLRDSGQSRKRVLVSLVALTRLWALDQLSARPNGIARPPWEDLGLDDYLPAATSAGGGENATEPIAEQTIGPLLTWAMRLVEDLSGDILAGWAERQRLIEAARSNAPTPAGLAALEAYLRPLIDAQEPLPATTFQGKPAPAVAYIGAITGASRRQVEWFTRREGMAAEVTRRPGPCPMDIPVTGRIAGRPWRTALDLNEAKTLMRHLGTAAFIVCAYLTGARPGEVLALRTGCCPDPAPGPDGQPGRHLIRGLEFKTATDDDGNHLSGGAEREAPWVAITPVVNAIRVLERMVPDGHLLFGHDAHDARGERPDTGSLKPAALRERIEDFTDWANREAARHGLPGQAIPADPHGPIGLIRFRRSLAWHIARRPNGLVALAIQYGHMRTALGRWATEGYASRSRDGIHDLIDLETARATADTIAALHENLQDGGGISGPAARRAIRAAATAPRFAGTPITLASARKLLKNEDAMIYDNPHALVLCHYKRDRALCHRDGARDTPSLDRCVPGCGNIARTDQQAAQLRERAAALEIQAGHVPQPVGDRLRATAAKLREQADKHERVRITAGRAEG
jgi:integrase